MYPDLVHGAVRADDHFIRVAADRVAVAGGEGEIRLGSRRIVVERLRERLVEGRGTKRAASLAGGQERPRPQDVVAFLKAGRQGVIIIVEMVLDRGRIEARHTKRREHLFLEGHGSGICGPPRRLDPGPVFVSADFVAEDRSGGRLGDRDGTPPVVGALVMVKSHRGDLGCSPPHAAGTFRIGSVGRVVDEHFEARADRIAFCPDGDGRGSLDVLKASHAVAA